EHRKAGKGWVGFGGKVRCIAPTGSVIVATGRLFTTLNRQKDLSRVGSNKWYQSHLGDSLKKNNVIQNGNRLKRTGRGSYGGLIILPLTTAEEHLAVQRESKARTTLLQSILDDHIADFPYMDDARDIWNAVKARFGGNDESKKMRKSMLKQEFLEFRISEMEGFHKGYDRMQKILSQLNQFNAKSDYEEINLRVHKFEQKARRKIDFDKKESARFNNQKVRCYKCQQRGHFARECRANGGNDKKRYSSFKVKEIGKKEEDSKALITVDTMVDWSNHDSESDEVIAAKEFRMIAGCDSADAIRAGANKLYNLINGANSEEANTPGDAGEFALIGVTSEVHNCPFGCDNKYNELTKMYDALNKQNNEYIIQDQAYKNSLKTLENQKRVLQKKIDNHLVQTEKWRTSSKNLYRLIDSSMSVRTKVGLGFTDCISQKELGWDDSAFSVFTTTSEDVEGRHTFHRFAKTDSIKVVPPPLTRDYTSLSDHTDLDESEMSYGTKSSTSCDPKSVPNDSVSCNDNDKSSEDNTNDLASSDSGLKSLEHKPTDSSCASTSSVSTSVNEARNKSNVGKPIKEPISVQDLPSFTCNSSDKNEHSSRTSCNKNGSFNKKAGHFRKYSSSVSKLCFVCGSGTHLIRDCDFYEKQMTNTTVSIGMVPAVRPQLVPTGKLKVKPVPTGKLKVKPVPTGKPKVKLVPTGKPKVKLVPTGKPKVTPVPTGTPQVSTPVPTGRPYRPFPVPTDRGYSPLVISGLWSHTPSPMPHLLNHTTLYFQTYTPYVPTMYYNSMLYGGDRWATAVKPSTGCSLKAYRKGFHWICDKKNQVLFTNTECLVLSKDFKLLDDSMVVLKVPRKHNLYTINLNDLCPRGNLACLVAHASFDECVKWHRRMAHVNYKNINRLVKGNLVIGLPPKLFKNGHTCVACCKGKQHKASYKAITAVSSIFEPLQLLHMDLFGPTSIRSIDYKFYCLVITDDYSQFCWVFFLEHKDETYLTLKSFINLVENQLNKKTEAVRTACYVLNRVSVTSPHNKTPYALLTGNIPTVSHFKPFGCHVTILNTSDYLGKFDEKADEGYIVGYSASNRAYRVYNVPNKRVEETINLWFLKDKPNVQGFGTPDVDSDSDCDEQVIIVPSYPSYSIQGTQPIYTPGDKVDDSSFLSADEIFRKELAKLKDKEQRVTSDAEELRKPAGVKAVLPGCIPVPTARVPVLAGSVPVPTGSVTVPIDRILVPVGDTTVPTDDVPVYSSISTDSMFDGEPTTRFPCPFDLGNHDPSPGIFSSSSYDDEFDTALSNVESSVEVSLVPTKRINTIHPQSLIIGDPTPVVQMRGMVKQNPTGDSAFISSIFYQQRDSHTDFRHCLFACFLSQVEARSVAQALEDPSWVDAMQEEMQPFKFQNVWVLVDLPPGKYAIGTKWILKNKRDARGIVDYNKARLVAQGHRHEEGIDYDEVFAPVTRIEAIRLFLAFASYMGFLVYQMDVKSVFLYGRIEEEVYVTQPKGFVNPHHPKKAYKVVKALYGLHQAPRAWYATLSTFLLKHGYKRGTIDKTLFLKKNNRDIILVQVYVDDIVFGFTKKEWCDEFEALMKGEFQMSAMGELTD
nr:putative ribonuclease H-like domain-containing protein [Tanacetum cinerariifolium]